MFPPSKRRELLETNNKRRGRRTQTVFTLNITSMIDMFTIILVFLLKSFSAEGELMSVSPNLELPVSELANVKAAETVTIALTARNLLLNGEVVEEWQDMVDGDTPLIPRLFALLQEEKSKLEWVTGLKGDNAEFQGLVIIQGDKGIPFQYIEKVMFTCGQAEYNNISLAVYKQQS